MPQSWFPSFLDISSPHPFFHPFSPELLPSFIFLACPFSLLRLLKSFWLPSLVSWPSNHFWPSRLAWIYWKDYLYFPFILIFSFHLHFVFLRWNSTLWLVLVDLEAVYWRSLSVPLGSASVWSMEVAIFLSWQLCGLHHLFSISFSLFYFHQKSWLPVMFSSFTAFWQCLRSTSFSPLAFFLLLLPFHVL